MFVLINKMFPKTRFRNKPWATHLGANIMPLIRSARSNLRKKSESLPRCHWNAPKQCSSKRKAKRSYETQEEADNAIRKLKKDGYRSYLCPYCNKWHIGHLNEE